MRYPAVLSARINETTWAAIELIADEHNFSVGEAVRMLLNEGIVQQKLPKKAGTKGPKNRGYKATFNTRRVS